MKVDEMVVFKYTIFTPGDDLHVLELPRDAQFLKVGMQDNYVMLWALVDPTMPSERFEFRLKGTGHYAGDIIGNGFKFLDTVFMRQFVWHIWYRRIHSE